MQLAVFFPALLLQTCDWHLDATVRWTRRRLRKTMTLTSEVPLVSHYRDQGAYLSKEQQLFQERFNALDTMAIGCRPGLLSSRRSVRVATGFCVEKGEYGPSPRGAGILAARGRSQTYTAAEQVWTETLAHCSQPKTTRVKKASIEFEGPILEFAEILSPKKSLRSPNLSSPLGRLHDFCGVHCCAPLRSLQPPIVQYRLLPFTFTQNPTQTLHVFTDRIATTKNDRDIRFGHVDPLIQHTRGRNDWLLP